MRLRISAGVVSQVDHAMAHSPDEATPTSGGKANPAASVGPAGAKVADVPEQPHAVADEREG